MRKIFSLAMVCALALSANAVAQKTWVLALSKTDHTLNLIDPTTLKVMATLPSGDDPHEVVANAEGTRAFVSNYGNGRLHTLTMLDIVHLKSLGQIDLGALRGPHGLDFAEGKVFFTAEAAKAIGSYDPATMNIDWIMGTGQDRTHMLMVINHGKRIVTTNVTAATVTILDKTDHLTTVPQGPPPGGAPNGPPHMGPTPNGPPPGPPGGDWVESVVPVGAGAEGFDVTEDGNTAWVANAGDGSVTVIDLNTKKVTATIPAEARGVNRLKLTHEGRLALLSTPVDVVVLDTATHKVVKHIPTGRGGGGILMDPNGTRAYESCGGSDYIAVIDLKTLSVVGHIDVRGPDGLAWASR